MRIPLANAAARDGFLKLSFLYSGAATQDRCIDVRYVGDSLTMRPESAVEFEIGITGAPNITTTAALMPQDVAIVLSKPQRPPADIATALTLARSLTATGRHVTFHHGIETLPELAKRDDRRRWTRGLIVVGALDRSRRPSSMRRSRPGERRAGAADRHARGGPHRRRAGRCSSPTPHRRAPDGCSAIRRCAALRDTPAASVGEVTPPKGPTDRVSFDELGLVPAQAEVFGRADLSVAIATRALPSRHAGRRASCSTSWSRPTAPARRRSSARSSTNACSRSTVAAIGEPTRLDFALPDGLVGTIANIRAVVQRRSAQGDCRFEPQGYPAQILGSSAVVLSTAEPVRARFLRSRDACGRTASRFCCRRRPRERPLAVARPAGRRAQRAVAGNRADRP